MAVYTHGHHESVLHAHRWRTAQNSAAYLLPHLTPGMTLLDVGCGPGTITADLAARVAPGRVTAVDSSEAALTATRAELARRAAAAPAPDLSGPAAVDLMAGDVQHLDLPDAAFDVTHAHQVLQHVSDPVGALREMRRVTRPGGLVAARDGDYAGFVWYPHLPELDDWLALYQQVTRANGGEPDAGRRLLGWARAAGFTDVTATSSTWCFATAEDRAWWGHSWAARIVDSAVAATALRTAAATRADLERIADGWRRWAAHPDGWLSVLHGEVLCRR